MSCSNIPSRSTPLSHSSEVAEWFAPLRSLAHEELWCIFLERDLLPSSVQRLARGERTSIHIRPRDVLRPMLLKKAAAFILVHNHPSGDASPSHADRLFTEHMAEGANTLDLAFVDHVVLGRPGHFSFADEGLVLLQGRTTETSRM